MIVLPQPNMFTEFIKLTEQSNYFRLIAKSIHVWLSASPLHYQSPHSAASKTKIAFRNTGFMPFLKAIFLISSLSSQHTLHALSRQ
ncbi:hypothetical protein [uncultured Clostridium sp.]|uniref:hypothetical protein n=1 Tax=uncultured Clostridium sp. TaxID=59620 RepID=UPI0028E68D2C|nr:hypothetical protein [uncultured Clostridium sp.]